METMMSRCLNCGWQDARNVQYCPRCGAPVTHGNYQNPAAANPISGYSNMPAVNPTSGYANAYGAVGGYPSRQTGNPYIPNPYMSNAGAWNYGSAPQPVQPPMQGQAEEQPTDQSRHTESILQQYFGTGKKPAEEQTPEPSTDVADQPAPESFEPAEPIPSEPVEPEPESIPSESSEPDESESSEPVESAPDSGSSEPVESDSSESDEPEQPASAFPKPGERWTSFMPPEGGSSASSSFKRIRSTFSSGSSSSTPAASDPDSEFSMPFMPSGGSNKGAKYVLSYLDNIWKGEIALFVLVLLVILIISMAENEPKFLGFALLAAIAAVPIITKSYVDAKVKGTFYLMAQDISAIHFAVDSIRAEQYKSKKDEE